MPTGHQTGDRRKSGILKMEGGYELHEKLLFPFRTIIEGDWKEEVVEGKQRKVKEEEFLTIWRHGDKKKEIKQEEASSFWAETLEQDVKKEKETN
ncbi:UNVERIFIED_CONTAM: hypothetical protein Sradi_3465900 [Sesamum radiatum]|uniref:Uncharacterized protein n=1 Tax=Sesamum radiatum TaxID=300843 RepID=A0AAW2R5T5_SESRA